MVLVRAEHWQHDSFLNSLPRGIESDFRIFDLFGFGFR